MKKNNFILCFFLLFATSLNAQTITDSLQAYYPFNGNANDESVNTNNGTVNSPSLIADRFNNANSAYNFNGTSDEITINNTLGNFGTSDFSISFWIKTTSANIAKVISKRPTCANDNLWQIAVRNSRTRFVVNEAGGVNFIELFSNQIVSDDNWHNIVCIRKGTTLFTYHDGVLDSSIVGSGVANLNNSVDLKFGSSPCIGVDGTVHYQGGLDDIRIYNRALSQEEIGILYNELPVGIESINKSSSIKIYPNPSSGSIILENNDFESDKLNITITDFSGRIIYSTQFNSSRKMIPFDQLATNGMYLIKITNAQNQLVKTEKLILTK